MEFLHDRCIDQVGRLYTIFDWENLETLSILSNQLDSDIIDDIPTDWKRVQAKVSGCIGWYYY